MAGDYLTRNINGRTIGSARYWPKCTFRSLPLHQENNPARAFRQRRCGDLAPSSILKKMALNFIERLKHSPVLCDGAMGTLLYAKGIFINRCYDELNFSQPELIRGVRRKRPKAKPASGAMISQVVNASARRCFRAPRIGRRPIAEHTCRLSAPARTPKKMTVPSIRSLDR